MAFKALDHNLLSLDASNNTKIASATGKDIHLYPAENVWISEGSNLVFEGPTADGFETTIQVTDPTADRTIIFPDDSGTVATQAYVTGAVTGGALSNTDALAEGSTNLYFTDARADARIAAATTTQLSEGTNLYFTTARAQAAVTSTDLNMTNNNITLGSGNLTTTGKVLFANMYATEGDLPNATTYHGMFAHVHATGKGYFAHGGSWRKLLDETSSTTANLAEGANLYYTDARVDARIALQSGGSLDLSSKTTSDLAEGTNLYYTAARDTAQFNTDLATKSTSDLAEGTNLYFTNARVNTALPNTDSLSEGSTNLYFTNARADARITNALGGNVIIGGNLTVSGTTTTVDSNVVNIADSIITLNSDETGTPSQNGGIEIERGTSTNVQLRFNETSDAWEFTNDGTTYVALGTSATFTGTTDGVNEGSTNLYYTDARVRAAVSATTGSAGYNSSTGAFSIPANTSQVSESGNLYYTDARADARIAAATTTNLSEGTNLYYTDARADARITNAGSANWNTAFGWGNHASAGYLTGYTVTQGDVDARLSGGTGVTYSSGTISIGQAVATSSDVQFDSFGVGTAASSTTGEIRATNDVTAYYSSDRSLKENVINITNALEKVKQIRGVEFDWTQEYIDAKGGEDGYFTRKHDVGVIAQEVEEVLPEVVGTREDGIKAVKYDRMVGLLIEAIKEQQSQIDELKQTVNNLTNK